MDNKKMLAAAGVAAVLLATALMLAYGAAAMPAIIVLDLFGAAMILVSWPRTTPQTTDPE